MRKNLIISIITILTIVTTQAQEFHFGGKGGINLANINNSLSFYIFNGSSFTSFKITPDYKISFYVEGFAEYELSERLYGEVGIQYAENGFSGKIDVNLKRAMRKIESGRFDFSYHQVSIPLFLKYEILQDLRLKGGAYIGYIFSAEGKMKWYDIDISEKEDTKDNKYDYGLSLGAEYVLENGILFDINYKYGLKGLFDNKVFDKGMKNRVIQVGIGYRF